MIDELQATFKENDFDDYKSIRDIIERTNKEKPKREDVAQLKRMLADSPRLWRVAGDFSEHALHTVVSSITGTPFLLESVRAGVEHTQSDLGYKDAPPLERMMINQIALCWLRLNMLERTHWTKTYESHNTETGLYWDRRLTNAQRRFTRAVESLAKVRALTAAARMAESRIERQPGNGRQLKAVG
jgi:hypothetical protein